MPRRYKLEHAIETDVGKKRKENQDSYAYACSQESTLFVVADGMGGARGGATASGIAVNVVVRQAFTPEKKITENSLRLALEQANQIVHSFGSKEEEFSGMGTTVVALTISDDQAILSFVGDSRAYQVRGGVIAQLSRDHTLVQELVDSGALEEEEAVNHPISHMLTRSLGPLPTVNVDSITFIDKIQPDDVFLLCCDGLYNLVEDLEIRDILIKNEPAAAAKRLVELANERGGTDNITVEVVKVLQEERGKDEKVEPVSLVSCRPEQLKVSIDFDKLDELFPLAAKQVSDVVSLAQTGKKSDDSLSLEIPKPADPSHQLIFSSVNPTSAEVEAYQRRIAEIRKQKEEKEEKKEEPKQEEVTTPSPADEPPIVSKPVNTDNEILSEEFDIKVEQEEVNLKTTTEVSSDGDQINKVKSILVGGAFVVLVGVILLFAGHRKGENDQASTQQRPASYLLEKGKVGPRDEQESKQITADNKTETPLVVVAREYIAGCLPAEALSLEDKDTIKRTLDTVSELSFDDEALLSRADQETRVTTAGSQAQVEQVLSPPLLTEEEKNQLSIRKVQLRDKIADIDAKLQVFSFQSLEESAAATRTKEKELKDLEYTLSQAQAALVNAQDNVARWQDRKSEMEKKGFELVSFVPDITAQSVKATEAQKKYEFAKRDYQAAMEKWRVDPQNVDNASRVSAATKDFRQAHHYFSTELFQALDDSLLQERKREETTLLILSDLRHRQERLNRHIGFLLAYSPSMTSKRRIELQRELLDSRKALEAEHAALQAQLSDREEIKIRRQLEIAKMQQAN